jgi:hypothetical protein
MMLATANHYTQLMLRDFHAGRRNIKYLTLLRYAYHIGRGKNLCTAGAGRNMMHHNLIRLVYHLEGLAFMTRLATALFGRSFGKAGLLRQTI